MHRLRLLWPTVLSLGLLLAPAPNCDIWWHLQIGRDICREHVWPSPDIYAYTTQHSWVVHSWLSDCFYYLLWLGAESIAPDRGERALALFRFVLLGVFVLVAYTWARRSSQNETLAVLVALCAATLTGRREVGPLLFTPLLFLYVYSFCRRREPMKLDWFLLPFLMLLWANVHGGFAIGAGVLVCGIAGQGILYCSGVRPSHATSWSIVALLAILITFVNPAPVRLLNRVYCASLYPTQDWRSLFWWFMQCPISMVHYMSIIVATLGAWLCLLVRERPIPSTLLSPGLLAELISMILASRHVRFIWMMVIPLLGCCTRGRQAIPAEDRARWIPLLILFVFFFLFDVPPSKTGTNRMPKDTLDYFTQAKLEGNVFAPWQWGGYLTWTSDKKAQVFVDTRIEPFTMQEIRLSWSVELLPARYLGELVEYGTEFIIMPVGDRQPEWEMLAEKGLIEFLHKNEHNFLARVNVDKVREVYTGTRFGTELPKDQTPFR